jgi:hypothetical protein
MKKFTILLFIISGIAGRAQVSPLGSYNFNGDPAAAYNKYMVAHSDNYYVLIGRLKVKGDYYLFGPKHPGNLYAKGETGYNIYLSLNTYNNEVEFYSTSNPTQGLVKTVGEVDSFVLHRDSLITEEMHFVYGPLIGSKQQEYYLSLSPKDGAYNLYKRYKSVITLPVSYADADLRQFELETEYFYFDKVKQKLIRIKPAMYALRKQFSSILQVDSVISENDLVQDREGALKKIFKELNNK